MKMRRALAVVLASFAAMSLSVVSAQELKSGFFIDNNLYSYRLNPASRPDNSTSFFGFLVGGVDLGINSNVGVASFLFPSENGGLVNGLNKSVSAEQFLGGLNPLNTAEVDLRYNMFAYGKYSKSRKAYTVIEANFRSLTGAQVPKTLFEALKVGGDNGHYSVQDLSLNTRNYAEIAFRYSRNVGPVTIGAAVKGLVGIVSMQADIHDMTIDILDDKVNVKGNGMLSSSISLDLEDDENYDDTYVEGAETEEIEMPGLGGWGAAVDLGVIYSPIKGLTISGSVTDLGAISWKNRSNASMVSSGSFTVNGDEDSEDILDDLFAFEEQGESRKAVMLPTQINIGAKYTLPFFEMVDVSALFSMRTGGGVRSYTDFRAGASITPGKVFSFGLNLGVSDGNFVWGGAANLRLGPVNIFGGIDSVPSRITPQMLPVDKMNTIVKFGLAFAFGKGIVES